MTNLSLTQKQTIKTWLQANVPNLSSLDDAAIRDLLNETASPAFKVYRTEVPMSEIMLNGFNWTRVDNLSIGKSRIWEWMTEANSLRAINPSLANIRAGINAVWVGTTADLDVRAAVYVHCVKDASVAEKLLASGSGTAPAQDGSGPATMALNGEGLVTLQNVVDIMAS